MKNTQYEKLVFFTLLGKQMKKIILSNKVVKYKNIEPISFYFNSMNHKVSSFIPQCDCLFSFSLCLKENRCTGIEDS